MEETGEGGNVDDEFEGYKEDKCCSDESKFVVVVVLLLLLSVVDVDVVLVVLLWRSLFRSFTGSRSGRKRLRLLVFRILCCLEGQCTTRQDKARPN